MGSAKLLTIEIGEKNIRVCEVGYGRPVVYRTVSFLTPEGTMYDGYIVSIDKLAEYLKHKLKAARLFRKDVIFSISSSRIMSRETEIPYVKEKLVRKVALARADEYFPTKLEDYVISTLLLTKSKQANKMRVNLVAAPRDLIASYFNLATKLGIRVESVDYAGNAIHQWLNRRLKKETALVVNIGYNISVASIMDEGRMRMQRNIATGIDRFIQETKEEQRSLETDYEDFSRYINILPEEEELPDWAVKPWELVEEEEEENEDYAKIKEAAKLSGENVDEFLMAEDSEKEEAAEREELANVKITESELELLTSSMLRMVEYYNSNEMGKPITKVYIIGEGAYVLSLAERIESALEIPTELMKQAFGAMLGRSRTNMAKGNVESFYITCMGAGISPVGMVSYEVRIARERKEELRYLRSRLIKLTVCLAVILALCRINFVEVRKQNLMLKDEISQKSYAIDMHDKYMKNKQEYAYLSKLDTATQIYNDNLLTLLIELENKLPQGTNISSFGSDDNGIYLTVNALDKKTAAKFIIQLRGLEYIDSVEVSEIKYNSKRNIYTMKMSCSYKKQKENG